MTAPDPKWVEAGAKALAAEGVSERSTGGLAEDGMAWVVVHAVEPLIRADEQRNFFMDAWEKNLREQIAQQIEADLRAKVEGLRSQVVGREYLYALEDFLALIEEAGRG